MKKLTLGLFASICWSQAINQTMWVGQSLCHGYNGTPALTTSQPYSNLMYVSPNFVALVNSTLESPGVQFGNTLAAATGSVFSVNTACLDGNPYVNIKKGTTTYSDGLTLITGATAKAANLGRTFIVKSTNASHGTNDLTNTNYGANLIQWQSDLETDFKAITGQSQAIPMFLEQASTAWSGQGYAYPASDITGNVKWSPLLQWEAVKSNYGKHYMVGPVYQLPYNVSDYYHPSNIGYRILGGLYAKAVKKVVIDGGDWYGFVPRTITRVGAIITARFWVPVGNITIDTTTIPDQGVGKGFEYWDASGSPPAISSISCSTDTCTITLASIPTGENKRLRYAFTATINTFAGTPGAARGNLRDSDTAVNDAGDHLYDWLITFDEPIGFIWPYPTVSHIFIGAN